MKALDMMLLHLPGGLSPSPNETAVALVERGACFLAETCTVTGDVAIGKGTSVWFGAVVRGDLAKISVGEYTNIQDLAVLHTDPGEDLEIGNHVTIGHSAVVHCRKVGDKALIGIGSILLGGAEIGEGSLIGAGALVLQDAVIPPYSVVLGVPGKVVGKLSPEQVQENLTRARRYYENALAYVRRQ